MIVRILSARVPTRNARAFEELLRRQLPHIRTQEGLVYVKLARQAHHGYEDVVLFEEWRDTRALHEWAGATLDKPVLMPGAGELVENVAITHCEVLDADPDRAAVPSPAEGLSGASGMAAGPTATCVRRAALFAARATRRQPAPALSFRSGNRWG